MAKVTRQIKVTLTKSLANHYGNGAGDEIQWGSAAEIIRVLSRPSIFRRDATPDICMRIRLFNQTTARLQPSESHTTKGVARSRPGARIKVR